MIAMRNILVPHDFSETSEEAVGYAVALAHNFGAKLHLLQQP
jgi:nucleotide-binding universal stress UspA family protein